MYFHKNHVLQTNNNDMNNKILFKPLAIICLFFNISCAFAQWGQQNSGTMQNLNEIFFPVSDTGYVVGEGGTVLKTTNGGINWNKLTTGLTVNFHEVYFINPNNGWIVGDSGSICHTINGGSKWDCSFLDSAANINLHSVYALNNNVVLVGGENTMSDGFIAKTVNGGSTWQKAAVENYLWAVDIVKIGMVNNTIGYALTRGNVLKTTDGGLNWRITDTASVRAGKMFSILTDFSYFPNNDTVYVCGWYDAYFGKTVNGGNTWVHSETYDYYSMDFMNTKTGYVGGWGKLNKTTDGGKTFVDASGGNKLLFDNIVSIDFTNEWTGYGCGVGGKIIKTINGGTTGIEGSFDGPTNATVYPNPTTGKLNFTTEANVQVQNMTGQLVAQGNNISTMDLTEQPAGVYVLTLMNTHGQIIQRYKIVKTE